ncbi:MULTISPECIES: [protein-PII] uridylyltransferase [unclassified Neisseria]|uniref:[protein-PII] uridylyltransferase n=1 Tax=unclassified Neisseria TaxID=2623750 RepID=UPI001072999B|nr:MULTISPECIES: [protein-PII] uridylyltransferase [unclassified Neisseria]MBF0802858.1 [protein-PII] uridylyltransferase [Neisseria sp. 19428wB4_WF04]TFU44640.1 [protein-PII] uridylyltransferase [Neisseria sp. WF04]
MQTLIQSALHKLQSEKRQAVEAYCARRQVPVFFERHTQAVERALAVLWTALFSDNTMCLLATGGFGRGEMYPYSDVDLALVSPEPLTEKQQEKAAIFVQALWDMQLAPAVKSGSVEELCESVCEDITGDTAFLEARFLFGNHDLAKQLLQQLDLQRDTSAFIEAKMLEMQQRHAKSQGSGALLEPNIKTCPGGLRDIHTMLWLARVQGLAMPLTTLISQGVVTRPEAVMLLNSHKKLAAIRIDLHLAAGRSEDRLIFDLQTQVAENMGWHDDEHRIKSEKLMRVFYRAGKTVMQLNGILLPMLRGRVYSQAGRIVCRIDDDYYQVGNQLAVYDKKLFTRRPEHLWKAIGILQTRKDILTLAPKTLRNWWAASRKINRAFYGNPENRRRFAGFFKHGEGLTHVMRFLNLYGALERYLPAWGKIVGLLQHDLFHIYPVDDHILTVLHNMRRLAMDSRSHELPFASALMHAFEKQHILYLAALFHDIAKGRGGDHSIEGVADARRFAADHFLSKEESSLLAWLVENHLLMSAVAQKEDIQDPDVIDSFCERVETQERLTALYLLTVADIRGTNPKLWNSWRAGLLENLFHAAARRLAGESGSRTMVVGRRRQGAADQLTRAGTPEKQQRQLWQALGPAYFVRHELREILWHTANLVHQTEAPQVRSRILPDSGTLEVMVFMPNQPRLFARLCRIFSRHSFDILAARAFVTEHGYILDTFIVQLPPGRAAADYPNVQSALEAEINNFIHGCDTTAGHTACGIRSRRSRHLPIAPGVHLSAEQDSPGWYTLEIVAANRPYLLADIAEVLSDQEISLRYAKIATLDERVEDSFVLFSPHLENPKKQLALKQALLAQLSA